MSSRSSTGVASRSRIGPTAPAGVAARGPAAGGILTGEPPEPKNAAQDARAPSVTISADTRAALSQALNRGASPLTDRELADMVGAQPGSKVEVTGYLAPTGAGRFGITLIGPTSTTPGSVQGRPSYRAERTLIRSATGHLTMHNDGFFVQPSLTGQSIGVRVFATEVKTLARLGVSAITTYAGRSMTMNGYYTWARFGYNTTFRSYQRNRIERAGFAGVRTLHDLMARPGGAAWWKQNGWEFDGRFGLGRNSASMRVLNAYLAARGITIPS